MKKLIVAILLITIIFCLAGCKENDKGPVLWINPGITEYWTYMSSTPGIELTAAFTLDLKNSDFKYHWVADQGTFLMWHGNEKGMGRIEDLGNDIKTNVHKLYWSAGSEAISEKSFTIHLTIEDNNTAEVIAETNIQIEHPEEGYFTIDQ
jgi:hypothetical protein